MKTSFVPGTIHTMLKPLRVLVELLLPLVQALFIDAQFPSDDPGRLAAEHPVLNGGMLEGCVVAFVLGGG